MTEQRELNPTAIPRSGKRAGRRRSSLYRRVLSLGAAAIIAAWLPFSVMYISAVNKQATSVVAISAPHPVGGSTRVVTTASGSTRVVAANGPTTPGTAAAPTPVTTRVS
jgi:hypothetical protein